MASLNGPAIRLQGDDNVHSDLMYAECARASLGIGATAVTITMSSAAVTQDLGDTNLSSSDAVSSNITAVGVTVDTDAGTFTVDRGGDYRLFLTGRVSGEENEDVLLEWYKNGTAMAEPHECNITIDSTTSNAGIVQLVSHESYANLAPGDVLKLVVLGSNDEAIGFSRFNWGLTQLSSQGNTP